MSSALQEAQQHLLAEALKDDGERNDALIQRLQSVIRSLQHTAGEAVLLPRKHATNLESLEPMLRSIIVHNNSNCQNKKASSRKMNNR